MKTLQQLAENFNSRDRQISWINLKKDESFASSSHGNNTIITKIVLTSQIQFLLDRDFFERPSGRSWTVIWSWNTPQSRWCSLSALDTHRHTAPVETMGHHNWDYCVTHIVVRKWMLCWYDGKRYSDVVMWWYGGVVIISCGDNTPPYNGGVVIWWYSVMVVWWCVEV